MPWHEPSCPWQSRGDVATQSISHSIKADAQQDNGARVHMAARVCRSLHPRVRAAVCATACMRAHRIAPFVCPSRVRARKRCVFQPAVHAMMILHARKACAPCCHLGSDPRTAQRVARWGRIDHRDHGFLMLVRREPPRLHIVCTQAESLMQWWIHVITRGAMQRPRLGDIIRATSEDQGDMKEQHRMKT